MKCLALILTLATSTAFAQTTQAAHETFLCAAQCTVTGVSLAAAQLQFGSPGLAAEVTWGPLFTPVLPAGGLLVNYTNFANLGGIKPPPDAAGDDDAIYAQQTTTAYTVSWRDSAGNAQTTAVPALAASRFVVGGIVLNLKGKTLTCVILAASPDTLADMNMSCTAAATP
jgi:hypothetical protein